VHEGENPARTESAVPAGAEAAGATAVDAEAAGAEDVTRRVAGVLQGIGPVLGIDAGGSGTRAVLIVDGAPTQRYSSGPFNFLLDGDGVPRMAALVRAAHPAAVGIGIPGLARVPDAAATFGAALTKASGVPARVAPDAAAAWLGAFIGGPGILVIAGTGSVAVGGGSYGELALIGGHGHLVGDEGGGYWIGRRALRAALAAQEGTGPATRLGKALSQEAGASLHELMVRVQRAPADRSTLARLAPVVGKCAEGAAQDDVARAILADAAAALTGMVTALRRRFGELPVAAAGGVFGIGAVWDAFRRATGAVAPLAPPQIGAALLAAQPEAG
jgi:glucosamine kinase